MNRFDEGRELEFQPCGRCDIGIYCEFAMLNSAARAFGNLSSDERLRQMPICKTQKRPCAGAVDFHNMICDIDAANAVAPSTEVKP